MDSCEDVPPLEDMSELIKQVDTLREIKRAKEQREGTGASLQNGHGNVKPINKENKTSKSSQNSAKSTKENHINGHGTSQQNTGDKVTKEKDKTISPDSSSVKENVAASNNNSRKGGFAGMKKGFLFGGPAKPKQTADKPKAATEKTDKTISQSVTSVQPISSSARPKQTVEDIPFVRKNEQANNERFRFSEVQETMEKTNEKLMQNKDWVTDDLLNKLEKNDKLSKRLQDQRFLQAIGEFQKNPTAALAKYGQNPEIQEFFQDFCGLMGDHFNKLGDQQDQSAQGAGPTSAPVQLQAPPVRVSAPTGGADMSVRSSTNPKQATAQDEAQMQQILSNPELQTVLMDPKIQQLFEALRNNPAAGQRLLREADSEMKGKIHKLVQAGLLQFQA